MATRMLLIAIGDFINGLLGFGVFYAFSGEGNQVETFLHALYTELGSGTVTTEDGDGLQSEELLSLGKVDDAVELDIVFISGEDAFGFLELLGGNGIDGAAKLDVLVQQEEKKNQADIHGFLGEDTIHASVGQGQQTEHNHDR